MTETSSSVDAFNLDETASNKQEVRLCLIFILRKLEVLTKDLISSIIFLALIFQNGTNCEGAFIQFDGTEAEAADRWCGDAFNSVENATTGGTMHGSIL